MKLIAKNLVSFLKREDGPTAVEYAVMLALIVVVCIAAITTLGSNANSTFSFVGSSIKGPGSGGACASCKNPDKRSNGTKHPRHCGGGALSLCISATRRPVGVSDRAARDVRKKD